VQHPGQAGLLRLASVGGQSALPWPGRNTSSTTVTGFSGTHRVAKVKELTNGLGAYSVIEEVGTQESMTQEIRATRPGGHIGYVGVSHDVTLGGTELFFSEVHPYGGPAPVRRFLPGLIDLIWNRHIDPEAVFDLTLPLEDAAEGYRAMGERRATKVLLTL
jgi:threonine dehydrogenase-like Zn-dependent dehydrogenase